MNKSILIMLAKKVLIATLIATVIAIPSALMLNYTHTINEAYSLGFIAGVLTIFLMGFSRE